MTEEDTFTALKKLTFPEMNKLYQRELAVCSLPMPDYNTRNERHEHFEKFLYSYGWNWKEFRELYVKSLYD